MGRVDRVNKAKKIGGKLKEEKRWLVARKEGKGREGRERWTRERKGEEEGGKEGKRVWRGGWMARGRRRDRLG